jgi:hypothetical protein
MYFEAEIKEKKSLWFKCKSNNGKSPKLLTALRLKKKAVSEAIKNYKH